MLLLLPATALLLSNYITQYLFYRTAGTGVVDDGSSTLQMLYTMSPSQAATLVTTSYGGYAALPALILGALVAGNDWGNGYLKTTLSQGPGRAATAAGQASAVLTAAAVSVLACYLTATAASMIIARLAGEELPEAAASLPLPAVTVEGVAIALLISAVYAAAGLCLGTAFRSAGGAVAAALIWVVGIQVLFSAAASQLGGAYAAVNDALPHTSAAALSSALGPVIGSATSFDAPVIADPGTKALILATYLIVFLLLNAATLARREIK